MMNRYFSPRQGGGRCCVYSEFVYYDLVSPVVSFWCSVLR